MKFYLLIFSLFFSFMGMFISGCTTKSTVLLEENYLNATAIPISLILTTWGKPTSMNYHTDGSSEMEWHGIEPTALEGYPLIPSEQHTSLVTTEKESLRCSVRFYINSSGKADSHALICYTVPQETETFISEK